MSAPPTDQEIQSLFNSIAPIYDQMNDWLSFGIHRVWKKMTVNWCQPQSDSLALDLCCGTGDLTFLLAQQVTHGKVIGVDFSSQLLAVAKEKQGQNHGNYTNMAWLESDVLTLPFADNYCDCMTMGYGLRNVVDIPACLQEVKRVLKPSKKIAILDFQRPPNQIIAQAQQWYIDNIVVNIAQFFDSTAQYAYINPSLDRFPSGDQQIKIAQEIGFRESKYYPLYGGIMGVLVLTK